MYRNERGFSGPELLLGAVALSVGISILTFVLTWIFNTKEARLNGQKQYDLEQSLDLEKGPEFGSFRITFDL